MKQRVVIIGHGYTSRLGVIRALGSCGYEVVVIVVLSSTLYQKKNKLRRPIDCYSKYVSQVHYCPHDSEALVKLLVEQCVVENQKAIVIPDSDFSAATIDLNLERLKTHFLFPHVNHKEGGVVSWMDKLCQKKVANEVGLKVVKGWVIEVLDGQYTIPSYLEYPCFPKPMASLFGGKGGLKKCSDEKELRNVLDSLISKNPTMRFLVEEYKNIETEYALLGVSDGKTVIIPGIIQTISLANGGHFGVAKQGRIKPIEGYEDLVNSFKQFVLKTGFYGIFDIDFYQSDGVFYFCEMNFRYGGSGYAYTAMGVNLPVMFVKMLLNEDYSSMQKEILEDKVFVNERMCLDDWLGRYLTTKQFHALLDTADISFIKDLSDNEPLRAFKREYRRALIKRTIRLLLKRN